jgi:hypothetical protein
MKTAARRISDGKKSMQKSRPAFKEKSNLGAASRVAKSVHARYVKPEPAIGPRSRQLKNRALFFIDLLALR